jgi:hypothetical protein
LGDREQHQLKYREIIHLFEKYSLCDKQDLVDEKDEKEKKECHNKGKEVLPSYVAIY